VRLCAALSVSVVLFAVGCERAPSKAQVVGSYSGTFNGAVETLVLSADGTFIQSVSLPSGLKVSGAGTWSLKSKAVTLDKYMLFYSGERNGTLVVQPSEMNGFIYGWAKDMLIRDWESGYYKLEKRRR
jgi:hypothetical protein